MSIYKPTWLYIKQHNQTGLKYFGKTVAANPENTQDQEYGGPIILKFMAMMLLLYGANYSSQKMS